MSIENIERLVAAYWWPVLRALVAAALTVGVYLTDQRLTQAEVRRDIERHSERLKALEDADQARAKAERAEGEWRGRLVERLDAIASRLDRIERKIDGGK